MYRSCNRGVLVEEVAPEELRRLAEIVGPASASAQALREAERRSSPCAFLRITDQDGVTVVVVDREAWEASA